MECGVGDRKRGHCIMIDETEEMDRGPHNGESLNFIFQTTGSRCALGNKRETWYNLGLKEVNFGGDVKINHYGASGIEAKSVIRLLW